MPRTTLLIADDVGLGKTIEAGLVVQELLLRHRARTALVVCPAALQLQWRDEMQGQVRARVPDRRSRDARPAAPHARRRREPVRALPAADRLDRLAQGRARDAAAARGAAAAPRDPAPLRRADRRRGAQLRARRRRRAGTRATRCAPQAIRTLAPHCEHRLFLSATPHNGYDNSFAALLELLDPHRFARGIKPTKEATREVTVRRLKQDLLDEDGNPALPAAPGRDARGRAPRERARRARGPRRLRRSRAAAGSAATAPQRRPPTSW